MDGIDRNRLTRLLALMGEEALLALAGQLASGLAALPGVPAAARADHLHRLLGGAASLGFAGLAAQLAAAEAGEADWQLLAGQAPAVVPAMAAALHAVSCQR